jgi:hypothetical protein
MHSLSTRTLSALAFDRGEEYDPGQPLSESAHWPRLPGGLTIAPDRLRRRLTDDYECFALTAIAPGPG